MRLLLFLSTTPPKPVVVGGSPSGSPADLRLPVPRRGWRRLGAYWLPLAGLLGLLGAAGCESTHSSTEAAQPAQTTAGAPGPAAPSAPAAAAGVLAPAGADSLVAAGGVAEALARAKPARLKPRRRSLRDTVGNGLATRLLGGPFDVNTLRYRRDPASPLMLKLARRTTLMVGVNSTESRLYRLFSDERVPPAVRAQPIALDRLSFDPGQAKLGAEAAQQLGNVAALMRTFVDVRLQLIGHAAPTEPRAGSLTTARAKAALAELLKQGIAPARLRTAYAPPKAGDLTPQGLSVQLLPPAPPKSARPAAPRPAARPVVAPQSRPAPARLAPKAAPNPRLGAALKPVVKPKPLAKAKPLVLRKFPVATTRLVDTKPAAALKPGGARPKPAVTVKPGGLVKGAAVSKPVAKVKLPAKPKPAAKASVPKPAVPAKRPATTGTTMRTKTA